MSLLFGLIEHIIIYVVYITDITDHMFLMTSRRTMNNANEQRPTNIMPLRNRMNPTSSPTSINATVQPEVKPKMKWGAPTWTFLHTLVEKFKDTSFPTMRHDLFRIIFTICTNLPCPICSKHAQEYLSKINVNSIQTKQDMIHMLFTFHNEVNQRKSVAPFPIDNLDKYKSGNYKAITNNFIAFFQEKTKNIHLIADEMFRQRNIKIVKRWIIDNIDHVELVE